jgi:hypothetical protein
MIILSMVREKVVLPAVSYIPKTGDASTCPPGEVVSTVRDVGVHTRDMHSKGNDTSLVGDPASLAGDAESPAGEVAAS